MLLRFNVSVEPLILIESIDAEPDAPNGMPLTESLKASFEGTADESASSKVSVID